MKTSLFFFVFDLSSQKKTFFVQGIALSKVTKAYVFFAVI